MIYNLLPYNELDFPHQWIISNIGFNKVKTTHLRFKNTIYDQISADYFLNNQQIAQRDSQHDSGVITLVDLFWLLHHASIVSKALKTLGLTQKTFGSSTPSKYVRFYNYP